MFKVFLERSTLHVVRFFAPNTIFILFKKEIFNIVKDLFKSFQFLCRSGKIQRGSSGEGIIVLGGLRKKVLSTLSDFALKILSLYILTKSAFQYSEGIIQII